MNKKTLAVSLLLLLLLSTYVPMVSAHGGTEKEDYPEDPSHLVIDTFGEPETMDPAWCYDSASGEVLQAVYDTLVRYRVDPSLGPYEAADPGSGEFDMILASDYEYDEVVAWTGLLNETNVGYPEKTNVSQSLWKYKGVLYRVIGHLEDPYDPNPGELSVSDDIRLVVNATNEEKYWHHVDSQEWNATDQRWHIKISSNVLRLIGTVNKANPVGSTWFDDVNTMYNVTDWHPNATGLLGKSAHVNLMNMTAGPDSTRKYHVDDMWGDPKIAVSRRTHTFKTRNPAPKFHDGTDVLPEDVEYSFERQMVQDRDGGPTWMVWEPLLGMYHAVDPATDPTFGKWIDYAVEAIDTDGDNIDDSVIFQQDIVFPPAIWLQITAYVGTGGIVNKDWAIAQGDFDGDWTHTWQYIWDTWHNPDVSPINDIANGAGPYKFSYWTGGLSWSIVKHDQYWQGWPAPVTVGSAERVGGEITTITWNFHPTWDLRRARLQGGDADFTDVNRLYRNQLQPTVPGAAGYQGIRCFYPYGVLSVSGYFFNFDIDDTTLYAGGPGGHGYPYGEFHADGIPRDVFSDINVRKGIAYNFDYDSWLAAVFLGEGWQPSDCIIPGLVYDNPAQAKYVLDVDKAKYHLKLAAGGTDGNNDGDMEDPEDTPGALWTTGMTFTITYNIGNVARQLAAEEISNKLTAIHPEAKFTVEALGVSWPIFLPTLVAGTGTIFIVGWGADYPDPHNFAYPFQHSTGTFARWQSYSNSYVDSLIEEGIVTPEGPDREAIYFELQALHHTDVPSVPLVQGLGRHWERDWIRGWHYETILSPHYYKMWKSKTHFGDANNDADVNIIDWGVVSASWTQAGLTYNTAADLSGGTGGSTGSDSTLVRGIPDGIVDIIDRGIISAYWDEAPQGPSHP